MAEAHQAVAFQFTVSGDGVDLQVSHEALRQIYLSGVHSWKKRLVRLRQGVAAGVFPGSPAGLAVTVACYLACCRWARVADPSLGLAGRLPGRVVHGLTPATRRLLGGALVGAGLWAGGVAASRAALRRLLSWHGWIEAPHGAPPTLRARAWALALRVLSGGGGGNAGGNAPTLYSFQTSLPRLPVPSVADTCRRYLESVRPLLSDAEYARAAALAGDFERGPLARRLQRYLRLKAWWASNYVSDWWEEFVYLRGRGPIMVNSNYYAMDFLRVFPTPRQAARAGNAVHAAMLFRARLDRAQLPPLTVAGGLVPTCSAQYERMFNTARVPARADADELHHAAESRHVAVYHRGRYFRVALFYDGRLLRPREIEQQMERILEDPSAPAEGEEFLAALTAGERAAWAEARATHFSRGVNRRSLDTVERAAFFVTLDDTEQRFDDADGGSLDAYAKALLHGKCHDRWFDKSLNLVVFANGTMGLNAEHSWADAPVVGHLWEHVLALDHAAPDGGLGYADDGRCRGRPHPALPPPQRLRWDLPDECRRACQASLAAARALADDVDLHVFPFESFGKGLVKRGGVSPDAFVQLALQLAHRRDRGSFCLTYESAMTRLFLEGRTETVRSCTAESCAFVRAMMEDEEGGDDGETTTTREGRLALLRRAAERHQALYRAAMTGRGVDRHLFCLYVVSRYLGEDSPFLRGVLAEPWRLSTSQTPLRADTLRNLARRPECVSLGGGFGPVADDGYGVSYIIVGEGLVNFHVSSKHSSAETDSHRFGAHIRRAMLEMGDLLRADERDRE